MRPQHHSQTPGTISVQVPHATLPDGRPAPAIEVAEPAERTIAWCLDVATDYATHLTGADHTHAHLTLARRAFLALLDASVLRKQELKDRLRGIDLWDARYPRPQAPGWDRAPRTAHE